MQTSKPKSIQPQLARGAERHDLVITSLQDGWPLSASIFQMVEEGTVDHKGKRLNAVVLATATGVPASFYHPYAAYLASQGSPTICFDFRLCGDSFPPKSGASNSPSKATSLSEEERIEALKAHPEVGFEIWTRRDFAAVCLYAWRNLCHSDSSDVRYRGLSILGNSLGGHMAPLVIETCKSLDSTFLVDRVLMYASVNPYFQHTPDPEARKGFTEMVLQDMEEDGFFDCHKWSLGNNIPLQAGKDWMQSSLQRNYIGSLKSMKSAFENYRTDTLGLGFTDDHLAHGSPRQSDGFSRILGWPTSVESQSETELWESDGETTGNQAYLRTQLPNILDEASEREKRNRTGWLNTRFFLDVEENGWVKGSKSSTKEEDLPRTIGHCDAFRPAVGKEGSKSREVWELMKDFLQSGALPEKRLSGGARGRRDFGLQRSSRL